MKGVQIIPVNRTKIEKTLRPELRAGEHFPFMFLVLDAALVEITEDTDQRLVVKPKKTGEPEEKQ